MKTSATFVVLMVCGLFLTGCGSSDADMKQQMADAKKLPPPTAAQMQKGFALIGANHEKSRQESADWAKAHPDQVASVNAARALAGKPPLGQ